MRTKIKLVLGTVGVLACATPISLMVTSCNDYVDLTTSCQYLWDNDISPNIIIKRTQSDKGYRLYEAIEYEANKPGIHTVSNTSFNLSKPIEVSTLKVTYDWDLIPQNRATAEAHLENVKIVFDKTNIPTYNNDELDVDLSDTTYDIISNAFKKHYYETNTKVDTLNLWLYFDVNGAKSASDVTYTWAFHFMYTVQPKKTSTH